MYQNESKLRIERFYKMTEETEDCVGWDFTRSRETGTVGIEQ